MRKKNIYLMYAIALLQGMVFYGPIATLYRQANGLSVFQITLIESISYLLCILFEIPWGIVADKIGYRKTMCFCCGLYFVSKVVFWRADGFFDFLLERIMLSVVIAGMSGVDAGILYLSCDRGESRKAFGIYNSLSITGLLSASLVFSVFSGNSYSMAAFLTVVSYGLAAILSFFLEEVKREETHTARLSDIKEILMQIMKDRSWIGFLISVAFVTQSHQTITVFLNQVQYETCGLSASAIGYIYIGVTLAGLSGVFSDRLTWKFGEKRTGVAFYLMAAAACVVSGVTENALVSVCGVLALNVVNSFYQPYQMELQKKQVSSKDRAPVLSVYAMLVDSVSAGTSVIFGALADFALKPVFFLGAGICLIGLLFFRSWYKD